MGARNEITLSSFDEATGIYHEVTVPRKTSLVSLFFQFKAFLLAMGFGPEEVDELGREERLCCGKPDTCTKPCTPRGMHLAERESQLRAVFNSCTRGVRIVRIPVRSRPTE